MPASSVHKAPQPVNHHQTLNEKINQAKPAEKSDYTRFEYLKYKHQEQVMLNCGGRADKKSVALRFYFICLWTLEGTDP